MHLAVMKLLWFPIKHVDDSYAVLGSGYELISFSNSALFFQPVSQLSLQFNATTKVVGLFIEVRETTTHPPLS